MPGDHIRLLALDGGGVRGLSSLMILRRLMATVDPESPPKPCEYFDMIGGTSTGGLIAIMLGSLGMTVDECIEAYTSLSDKVFEKKSHRVNIKGKIQGRFDTAELERAIKQILQDRGLSEEALLKDADGPCKVKETGHTVCLKSYRSKRSDNPDLLDSTKIWQACRATSAATTFFDPVVIGPFGEEYVDGALAENNPIYALWNQAQDIWGDQLQSKLGCLVSIGTGIPNLQPVHDDALGIWATLKNLATETEKTAQQFHRDKSNLDDEGRYYRFNVDRGLGEIGLEESKKKNEIAAATRLYVESQAVFKLMKACVENAAKRSRHNTSAEEYSRVENGYELLLKPVPQDEIRRGHLGARAPGTCLWLLADDTFKIWMEEDGSMGTNVLWFLWQHSDIPAAILEMSGDPHKRMFDSFASCQETFLNIFKERQYPYYIVLDALDELGNDGTDRPDLLSFLRNISSLSTRVKVLVTGREEDYLQRALSSFPTIRVSEEATHDDVQRFVSTSMRLLRMGDPDLEVSATETIVRKSGGIFRLATLISKEARDYPFTRTSAYFDNIPTTLFGMYERYLMRITRHSDQLLVHLALRLLKIVVAASRPLEWKELKAALGINPGNPDTERWNELNEGAKGRLLDLCSPLIEFRGQEDGLYLTHLSVKEYLLSHFSEDISASEFRFGESSARQCHLDLATRCLTYLSIGALRRSLTPEMEGVEWFYDRIDLPSRDSDLFAKFPFLGYAIENWAHHFIESDMADASANDLRRNLIDSRQTWRWLEPCVFPTNLRKQGEYWAQLFQIRSRVLGQQDLTTIYTGFCLARVYHDQNDVDSATWWYGLTISTLLTQSQSDDVRRGVEDTTSWMSDLFSEENETERMWVKSLFNNAVQCFGILHQTTRCLLETLGSAWPSKRTEVYNEVYQNIKRHEGINNEGAIEISWELLKIYEREKLWDKAKILCWEYCLPSATLNSRTRRMRSSLGRIAESQDSLQDAEAVYNWHMESFGRASPETQDMALVLGRLYAKRSQLDEVERLFRINFDSRFDQTSPQSKDITLVLAKLYAKQGRFEQAEGIYRIYFGNCEESLGSTSVETLEAASLLGETLNHQGKYDELEVLFHHLSEAYVLELDEANPGPWKIVKYLEKLSETIGSEHITMQLQALLRKCDERFTRANETTWKLVRYVTLHLDNNGDLIEAVNLCRRYYLGNNGEEDLSLERDREVSWDIANIQRVPGDFHSEVAFLTETRRIFGDAQYPAVYAANAVLRTLFNMCNGSESESSFDTDGNDVSDLSEVSPVMDTLEKIFYQHAGFHDEGLCGYSTREFGKSLADFYTIPGPCRDLDKAEKIHRLLFEAARDSQKFGLQGWWTLLMLKRLGEDLHRLGNIEEEERLYLEMMKSFNGALGKRHDRTIEMVRCLQELYTRESLWDKKGDLEREMLEGVDRATLERAARQTRDSIADF
ncbi:hypothetical protein DL771_006599 [Monosporascus sp. 5C6A]|nr:hypothetical protein DL771_006599 [Monosporascus sp. 5C6A]